MAKFELDHATDNGIRHFIIHGPLAAMSTPQCPKCGGKVTLQRIANPEYCNSKAFVQCEDCEFDLFIDDITELAQFFHPAPSPPPDSLYNASLHCPPAHCCNHGEFKSGCSECWESQNNFAKGFIAGVEVAIKWTGGKP